MQQSLGNTEPTKTSKKFTLAQEVTTSSGAAHSNELLQHVEDPRLESNTY
jgi:hypothetical protein